MPLPHITRKRRFVQGLLIAAELPLHFATVSGNPFLRTETPREYSIRIAGGPPAGIELLGQIKDIRVPANQHRDVNFMLHITKVTLSHRKLDLLLVVGNRPAASVTVSP